MLSFLIGAALILGGQWTQVGVPTTGTHFGDLLVILLAAECAHRDPSWSITSPPCVTGVEIYNYPSLWAKAFGLFGIGSSAASVVALAFILIFSLAIFLLMLVGLQAQGRWFMTITMSAAALSPPVLLALERGNIDIVIFALTTLSIALLVSMRAKTSAGFLGIATALKLFPIGSVLMFLPRAAHRRSALVTYFLTSLIGFALIARDLPVIYSRTPALDGASFGSSVLPLLTINHTSSSLGPQFARASGWLLFAIITALLWFLSRTPHRLLSVERLASQLRMDPTAQILVLAGGGAFLTAYLIGPSFDYRLITLLPAIAGFARCGSTTARVAALLLLGELILSYSTFVGSAEYLGDLLFLLIAPALAVTLIRSLVGVRQTLPGLVS